jgi:glycosyltransferase involved in cell wall biosynthesis
VSKQLQRRDGLVVIETHPIQYHAPVYRTLQQEFEVPVTAIYGSDFSVAGYADEEFGASFAWDTDLLSGYTAVFLSRVSEGGATSARQVSAQGLGQALRQARPGTVLMTGYSPRFHQVAFLSTWRAGYPILFRGETTDHARPRGFAKAWLRDRALQVLYRRCAALLHVGQRSYAHLRRLGRGDQLPVFSPYCVDTIPFQTCEDASARLRPATREQLRIGESETVILFSGKLSSRKGPGILLEALKLLPPEVRERMVLVFLGDGELKGKLERQGRMDPHVALRFLGFQNQTQLSRYYHASDLLVLPSIASETWGLVVNEALHHGIPCVVSEAVGCAPDLVEPGVTGEVARAGSAFDLCSAIQRAIPLTGRLEIREACRQKASNYSVEKAAEGIAQAYWTVK